MIELQNVTKDFGEGEGQIHAVHDISLTIEDGEIFGIIGLSGAGKSTLVRCINLLERPTSGSVIVDGKDLTKLPQKELLLIRRSIGMIFQGFNLLAQRTVLQNVCYPLEIAGWKKKESVERAMELLSVVGLADRAKAYPSQLSGGQKQRVIDQICDRVAVIDRGQIAELGAVSQVFTNPQSKIARELILPGVSIAPVFTPGGKRIRLAFNGETTRHPVVASLIMECQAPVNIVSADIREIDGKIYGQTILELPADEASAERARAWLKQDGVSFEEV